MLQLNSLPQCSDSQICGNALIRDAGYHASVVQIDDCTIITLAAIREVQVCEVRAPFDVDFAAAEILIQEVRKYLVSLPFTVFGAFGPHNRP